MSDKDRARKIADLWSDCLTQSEQDDLAAEILSAFAALREECATVAETVAVEDIAKHRIKYVIADAIRTGQPAAEDADCDDYRTKLSADNTKQ
jgi:hypothetical protein